MNFPDPNVTTEYESPDGLKYVWNGFAWEIECGGAAMPDTSIYLSKYGETVDDAVGNAEYKWNKPVSFETTKNGTIELKAGGAYVKVITDGSGEDDVHIYGADTASLISAGGTTVSSGWNMSIKAEKEINIKSANNNVIIQAGDDNAEFIGREIDGASNPKQITNKEYVDTQDEQLRQDIIELEEEIEALAPSLDRGQWNYKQILENRAYSLFDTSGQTTDMFNNVASIYVSTIDADGNPHGFDDVVTGSYVEIFNDTDADFGLYVIKDIDDKSTMNPGYWIFTVDFIKSNRLPSKANGLARFKFFEAPTGGKELDKKGIQVAGLQLGSFKYRRSGDSFTTGSMRSNTSTDPKNITMLDIYHTNNDTVFFGKDFYEEYIQPKMYVRFTDGSTTYVGKISAVDNAVLSNGIRVLLNPIAGLISGSVFFDNQYDVSIGYSKYIGI